MAGYQVPEPVGQQTAVVASGVLVTAAAGGYCPTADPDRRFDEPADAGRGEEHRRRHRAAEEHVVVAVQEMLGEPVDVVQLAFHRERIERRQRARVGEVLGCTHDRDLRVIGYQPCLLYTSPSPRD